MVAALWLWKNGSVSAASISGGTLNEPLPKQSRAPLPLQSKPKLVTPKPPSAGWGSVVWLGSGAVSTPVLALMLEPPGKKRSAAPALEWHVLQIPKLTLPACAA